jgi:DNA processing protein
MTTSSQFSPATQLLALTRFGGMTPRIFVSVLQQFGTLTGILDAELEEYLPISGISAAAAKRLARASNHLAESARLVEELGRRDIRIVTRFDEDYGRLLSELNDPPPLLYLRGRMPDASKKSVTLVGTHSATEGGIELTTRLARSFAEAGVQVISSLNVGNDAAAHLGAKAAGGVSFSVIDTGFDHIPQTEGIPLAIDITQGGGIVSEYPPEFDKRDSTLEASNRLLVGLGQAVVVTEIYKDSRRTHDIIEFCKQIGMIAFLMIDPKYGPLADSSSLEHALRCGVIPMEGLERTNDIIKVLV